MPENLPTRLYIAYSPYESKYCLFTRNAAFPPLMTFPMREFEDTIEAAATASRLRCDFYLRTKTITKSKIVPW